MRSRRVVAAVFVGAIVCGIAPPCPVLAAGGSLTGVIPLTGSRDWAPVFASDFSGMMLPAVCQAYNGSRSGQTAATFRPDEVQLSGGMLRLSLRRRDFADRPYTAGGLGCTGLAQRYGKYVYRARVAPASGADSFVTLMPDDDLTTETTLVEAFSEPGRPSTSARAHVSNAYGEGSVRKDIHGLPVDGFHEYQIEWSPNGLRVLIDRRLAFVDSNASAKYRWPGFAVSTDGQESGLPNQDDLPTEFLIDWVRVYAYAPGSGDEIPTTEDSEAVSEGSGSSSSQTASDSDSHPSASTVLAVIAIGLVLSVVIVFVIVAFGLPTRLRRGR
ncbi:MAG: glycoside hydrolase family 16 protein [Micromonosporaceae bacterium]|nr:glycoside hydrolase family 16 protein [Micromonosporaceae bacterium]